MNIQESLEDFGVKLAFAEANASDLVVGKNDGGPSHHVPEGGKKMDVAKRAAKRKAVVYGCISAALYAVLYAKSETIMTYFTKGHFFAVLPVAAAFLFSFVHGNFTGNFWTALGVNASSKATSKPTVEKPLTQRPTKRPDQRPRARAQM